MSKAQNQHITPPLTPPPTNEKAFTQAHRVIEHFKRIQAGAHIGQLPWTEFQLVQGEYDEIDRLLSQDESLSGYVKDKIRYDYDGDSRQLVLRMPTGLHELFIDDVEDAIRSLLKGIRSGSDRAARFAQNVRPTRSTQIFFPVRDAPSKSKYEPDASFWHRDAQFPGVIIEVAYSQKRKRLGRLAENYLLDSDASVQVVVGLDIEYGEMDSRKATLSVWRTRIVNTELIVVQEVANEAFRDDQGNPTEHPGLRLQLSDFANKRLVEDRLGREDRELVVSTQQLCQYLAAAEDQVRLRSLSKDLIAPGIKKRKRSETPPDQITASDEEKWVEQEEADEERIERDDPDYKTDDE